MTKIKVTEKDTQNAQKVCIDCKQLKQRDDFYMSRKTINQCKNCISEKTKTKYQNDPLFRKKIKIRQREWRENNKDSYNEKRREWATSSPRGIYSRLKNSTKKNGYKHIITIDEFIIWYKQQKKHCAYCGVDETSNSKICFMGKNKLSIDRIDSSLGYISGNIIFACPRCNSTKNNIFSFAEMFEIAQIYIKPKWQNNN